MKKFDPGEWAEQQVRAFLVEENARCANFCFHRYPDTKAARSQLIAAQPSDYLVANNARLHFHIEVKETAQPNRLPKAKIRQYGQLLKWWHGGIHPRVVIFRSAHNDWTWIGPDQLFGFDVVPPSFDMTGRPSFSHANELLQDILA